MVTGNALQLSLEQIKNEIEQDEKVSLQVPAKLLNPDPIIRIAKENLDSDKPDTVDGLVRTNPEQLDMKVSPKNVGRALRFMDCLIKALKVRGHRIELSWKHSHVKLFDQVNEQIKLREQSTRTKQPGVGFTRFTQSESYTFVQALVAAEDG